MNIFSKLNLSENAVKVTKNIGWALLGKVATLLGSFIVGIFVARYLGPEQYGLMSYVIAYVSIFQTLALFGMDNIEIREEAKNKEERDAIIGTAFVLKLIFAVVTMLLIFITIIIYVGDSFTRTMIMLYSLTIVCSCFFVARNYFTAIVWNEYVVKTEIVRTVIGVIIKVLLLVFHAKLVWFIVAVTFDYVLLALGYCLSYSKKIDRISLWHFDKKWAKVLLRQSFPLMLSLTAVVLMQRIDQIMIERMIGNESVGQYSVAFKFVEVMIFVPTIIAQTIAPMLVKIRNENKDDYVGKSQIFMDLTVWFCVIMAVVVCIIACPLVRFTFGEQYLHAVPVLQIMAFKVIGDALSQVSGQMIIIEGIHKYVVIREILGCICCVVMNFILIPSHGIIGSAVASVCSIVVSGFLSQAIIPAYHYIFVRELKSIVFGWRNLLKLNTLLRTF